MIDLDKPYTVLVVAIANHPTGNVTITIEQEISWRGNASAKAKLSTMTSIVKTTVNAFSYVIEYKFSSETDSKKMIIDKGNCDTDKLFQLCTVHPFYIEQLKQLLSVVDRGYSYVMDI